MTLLRDGVLVREDVFLAVAVRMLVKSIFAGGGGLVVFVYCAERFGVGGVDCGHDGEVVLVFVEVVGGGGVGVVEGVGERGVEGPEGEFVDLMREVERCISLAIASNGL